MIPEADPTLDYRYGSRATAFSVADGAIMVERDAECPSADHAIHAAGDWEDDPLVADAASVELVGHRPITQEELDDEAAEGQPGDRIFCSPANPAASGTLWWAVRPYGNADRVPVPRTWTESLTVEDILAA